MKEFYKRIGFEGKLADISKVVCKEFNLGEYISNKLIPVGYEDFNFVLETNKCKYFVKIFSNFRTDNDCYRYIDILLKAIENKVSFPKLFKSEQGYLHITKITDSKLRLCVMQYIDGNTFFSLGKKPVLEEIKEITRQAALINSINIRPKFIYDSWAIVNFLKQFEKEGKFLSQENFELLNPLIEDFKEMKIEKLPHCFVHGDIISTNVMKDKNNKIWIIDFAVSNYYPRIQELAIIACNLLFDEKDKKKSESNFKIALKEYQKIIKLNSRELEALPTYIKLAHAMHILQANYEKVVKGNESKENEYWLNQGKIGFAQSQTKAFKKTA